MRVILKMTLDHCC